MKITYAYRKSGIGQAFPKKFKNDTEAQKFHQELCKGKCPDYPHWDTLARMKKYCLPQYTQNLP